MTTPPLPPEDSAAPEPERGLPADQDPSMTSHLAAEHLTAVTVAMKNKMDLTLGIAVGSSTQIALFVAPVLVFVSLLFAERMNLLFNPFELVVIGLAVVIVNLISNDGESNWYEGVQLLIAYAIAGIAFFFHD